MKQITKTYDVYSFDELSENAKQKALADHAKSIDYDWYDFVYEDAKTIGSLMGIDVNNIFFSGFCSQGDGACFEGGYGYKKNCVNAVMEYAPKDSDLHNIVKTLAAVQKRVFYQLTASVKHSGYYYHENCTVIDVEHYDRVVSAQDEKAVKECLRDFMRWIYKRLENEYDYITSEESFSELCTANDWEFLESGEMV